MKPFALMIAIVCIGCGASTDDSKEATEPNVQSTGGMPNNVEIDPAGGGLATGGSDQSTRPSTGGKSSVRTAVASGGSAIEPVTCSTGTLGCPCYSQTNLCLNGLTCSSGTCIFAPSGSGGAQSFSSGGSASTGGEPSASDQLKWCNVGEWCMPGFDCRIEERYCACDADSLRYQCVTLDE